VRVSELVWVVGTVLVQFHVSIGMLMFLFYWCRRDSSQSCTRLLPPFLDDIVRVGVLQRYLFHMRLA
jgi:hypothetical protein